MVDYRDFDGNYSSNSDIANSEPSKTCNGSREPQLSKCYLRCLKGLLSTLPPRQEEQGIEEGDKT